MVDRALISAAVIAGVMGCTGTSGPADGWDAFNPHDARAIAETRGKSDGAGDSPIVLIDDDVPRAVGLARGDLLHLAGVDFIRYGRARSP